MPTFQQANNIAVLIGKYLASSYLRATGVPRDADVVDNTTFGKTSKVYDPSLKDATLSFDGLIDTSAVVDTFMNDLFGTADTPFSIGWAGTALGGAVMLGNGISKHYEQTGEVGGYMAVAGEMQASGGSAGGKWIQGHGALTGTTNGTSSDNGAATSTGWEANEHITALAGASPNVTVKIQHSTDNSSWVDLATFTAATAITAQHLSSASATTTVNRYVRVVITFAGTTSSCTFAVSFARGRQV